MFLTQVTKPDTHWVKTCPSQERSQSGYSFSQTCLSRHIRFFVANMVMTETLTSRVQNRISDTNKRRGSIYIHLLYFLWKLNQSFDNALTSLSNQPVLIIIITHIKSIILISVLAFFMHTIS